MLLRATHILLAVSLLLSTVGITVSQHFCRNTLVDTALFGRAKACGMLAKQAAKTPGQACGKHNKKTQNGCCKDHSEYHQLDQDQQITLPYFKLLQQPVALALPWPPVSLLPFATSSEVLAYLHYRPPLIFEPQLPRLQIFRL